MNEKDLEKFSHLTSAVVDTIAINPYYKNSLEFLRNDTCMYIENPLLFVL